MSKDTPQAITPAQAQGSWWRRLKEGLSRSSVGLSTGISDLFTKRRLDAATLDDFEDVLLRADLGVDTATRITRALASGRYGRDLDPDAVKHILVDEIAAQLSAVARPLSIDSSRKPYVILVIGVNGSGKTTTIGKLGAKLKAQGRSVMLAAGDTFRAAAIEQLKLWGERIGAPVIAGQQGADAAGLAFEALAAAREQGVDVLLLDTAGRLQNRAELMGELEKIVRVGEEAGRLRASCLVARARRDGRAERPVAGRDLRQDRGSDRSRHDEARRHGERRHPRRDRRQIRVADPSHRRRGRGGRSRALLGTRFRPRARRRGVVVSSLGNAPSSSQAETRQSVSVTREDPTASGIYLLDFAELHAHARCARYWPDLYALSPAC